MRKLKVIISGGGTGGHIFPAIAIAKSLEEKQNNIKLLFVGAKNRMEMEKIPLEGYNIEGLWISGFQRRFTIKNILFPFKILASIWSAKRILSRFKPDIVIGTGGYASGPVLYVAAKRNIPCIIQEQNSYPGVTNRILSRYVQKVCVAYDNMQRFFPKEKIYLTGNPIRKKLLSLPKEKISSITKFNLKKNSKTVLVVGGSLGALSINSSINKNLHLFKKHDINLIWQTGVSFYAIAQASIKNLNKNGINAYSFIKEMELAYSAADFIISRAGAIAISELCCIGKPVILVPSPNVSENHQYKNAQSLVNKNAALMVEDVKASSKLVDELIHLINDHKMQRNLSQNIKKLAIKDAADRIADLALKMFRK